MKKETTHFGFKEVPTLEKARYVNEVFHSVATKYDLMNDLMSFGLHRIWKTFTIKQSGVRQGQCVLDIAGGTGDLTWGFAQLVGKKGLVTLLDINAKMLAQAQEKLCNQGIVDNVRFIQGDAEQLPFMDDQFDCVSIAFGLRNVTDKKRALASMFRVLKPGGKCLILEFSKPVIPLLHSIYDAYSFHVIPKLGAFIAKDKASYAYLVESIRMHPDQHTLKNMLLNCGFEDVGYHNLCGGIVALHKGYKY